MRLHRAASEKFTRVEKLLEGRTTPRQHTGFKLAAEQGDASAQCRLAMMHSEGVGMPQDNVEMVRLLQLSASQGTPLAQWQLGACYAEGRGVAQDFKQAAAWLKLAAQQVPKSKDLQELHRRALAAMQAKVALSIGE